MQPIMSQVHKDSFLTGVSIGYKNPMFVADMVFPNVPVMKQSDYFLKFLKGAWFRNEAEVRGPGAEAAQGGYPLSSDTYACMERAFKHKVPIEIINNADTPVRPFETGTRFATNKVMLAKEIAVASLCMTSGNWTSSNDVNAGWVGTADGSGNTFITDILTYKETIRQLIGVYPNRLILDAKTFKEVKQEYTVLERIKYTGTQGAPADVTTQTLAQLFELDWVGVAGAIKSTAEEVVAGTDFTAVDIWEVTATKGSAFLYYATPTPAIDEPSAGYTFSWRGSESPVDAQVESDIYRDVRYWWDQAIKSYWVEAAENFDVKATCADAGCLFYDTIVT